MVRWTSYSASSHATAPSPHHNPTAPPPNHMLPFPSGTQPSQVGFFPQTLEETNTGHWRMFPPQSTRATTFQHEFSTHFKGIFEVLIVSCFSPGCCLHALDRSILLLHPWLPSFSRELLLSGNPAASSPHSPAHCRHHTYLHNVLLRCL